MRERVARVTGGAPALPLVVLFALNLVDELDRVAFGVLTPEIRDAFGLSDDGVVAIGAIAAVTGLVAALPIAVLADRIRRVRVVAVAAVVWGTMAVVTGLAPTVVVLLLSRLGAGVGRVINEPVHASLLVDYYEPKVHPRVFAVHRVANPVGLASAVVIGALGAVWDWRVVFIVLAVPTFALVGTLAKLREPVRGESVDRDLAKEAAKAESVPFGEARRQLFAVRTLRRLWLAGILLGTAAITLGQIVVLFFEHEYGFGSRGRGLAAFLAGLGTVTGLVIGQRGAARALAADKPERLARYHGAFVGLIGVGMLLVATAPWAPLSLALTFVVGVGAGGYQPNYFPLVGMVCPPRVRTQGFAWAIVYIGLGGLLSPVIAGIGEDSGYRLALALLSALLLAGGAVAFSSHRFVARDVAQARATLETAVRLRQQLADSGEQALLTCRGVDVSYDSVQVLFGVDIDIREGEIVALLGTNGAGKSTLLKAITGLVDPGAGAIFYAGRDVTHADAAQCAQLGITQMPGGRSVFPTLTVAEHFAIGSWLFANERDRVEQATEEVLQRFPRLRERWDQQAGNLSGGEQQMLGLGMAFIARPRLLMIDELSLGLAPSIVAKLLEMVRHINAQGTTVIVVEQSVNVALTLAQRAYFMEKGQVRFEGPTAELLERGDLLRSVFLEGAGGASRATSTAPVASVAAGVDRSSEPILSVRSLSRSFGGIRAVDGVSFDLHPGEIIGLIGPNGAGKTTVFDLVSGFLPPDTGSIRLAGIDVTAWPAPRRADMGLGRSFQDARIFPSLTVAENLAMGLERHLEVRDHLAAALAVPEATIQEDDIALTVDELVELMNLGAFRDKFVSELSTGSRRIVDLAMAIAHNPSVLILDEPSSGIAQRETEALGPLLRRIRAETGCAMLVIEHDMPLITAVSDRMLALELGRVIAEGTPAEVVRDPRVVASYLGGDQAVVNRSGAARRRRKVTA